MLQNHRVVDTGQNLWRLPPVQVGPSMSTRTLSISFWMSPKMETFSVPAWLPSLSRHFCFCLNRFSHISIYELFLLSCHTVPPRRFWQCLFYTLLLDIYIYWSNPLWIWTFSSPSWTVSVLLVCPCMTASSNWWEYSPLQCCVWTLSAPALMVALGPFSN